jgi:hypothetical protein
MPNRYLVGQAVTVKGTYTYAPTGAAVDPVNACVDIVAPTGKVTTYKYTDVATKVVKVSTGIYTYDVDTTGGDGRWQYRWWSPPDISGIVTASASEFIVAPFPAPTP